MEDNVKSVTLYFWYKEKKKNVFYTYYRIIEDNFNGYEVQVKKWWFPFWIQKSKFGMINTFNDLDKAKEWVNKGCPKDKNKTSKKREIYWKSYK